MKSTEQLQKSYLRQKQIFEEAKGRRIANRQKQIEEIRKKIQNLQFLAQELESQNNKEQEFESFETFHCKSENQSQRAKTQKTEN